MPQVNVDLLLNRIVYATGNVDIKDSALRVVDRRTAGQVVGRVDSWVLRNGRVYLIVVQNSYYPFEPFRLVGPSLRNLTLSKADAEAVRLLQKAEERKELSPLRQAEEAAEKEEKGSVRFYIEKYGRVVLIAAVGAYLVGTFIKKRA